MKLRKLLFGVSLYAVMSAIWSEPVALHPEAPQSHRVVAGETLWDIAARFLRDPWRWPEVWRTNPQLEDPHLIFPGDRITLSYHAERGPSLELQRELPRYPISPQIRVRELEKVIPTLALDAIQPFLLHSQVVDREALEKAPYVVAGTEERLVLGVGDEVYVRGFSAPTSIPYGIYRSGEAYRDPDSPKRILGYEALFIAAASVRQFGDPAIVRIQNPTREVLVGDRLLPVREREFEYHFFPHAPSLPVEGKIIAVVDGVSQIGQHQVVVLNLGAEEGIARGSVLGVYQAGREVHDPISRRSRDKVRLPDERAGVAMIFHVFEHMSYALIMRAERAIHVYDLVRNP
jgi:hypothetical protein